MTIRRYNKDPRTEEQKKADEEVLDLIEKGEFLSVDPAVEQKAVERLITMTTTNAIPHLQNLRDLLKTMLEDEVDDSEEILTSLCADAEQYVNALNQGIKVLLHFTCRGKA